jgi:hypothetical protein
MSDTSQQVGQRQLRNQTTTPGPNLGQQRFRQDQQHAAEEVAAAVASPGAHRGADQVSAVPTKFLPAADAGNA